MDVFEKVIIEKAREARKRVPMPDDATLVTWHGMTERNAHDEVREEMATWIIENWAPVRGVRYFFNRQRERLVSILFDLTAIRRVHELMGGGVHELIQIRYARENELMAMVGNVDRMACETFRRCL